MALRGLHQESDWERGVCHLCSFLDEFAYHHGSFHRMCGACGYGCGTDGDHLGAYLSEQEINREVRTFFEKKAKSYAATHNRKTEIDIL